MGQALAGVQVCKGVVDFVLVFRYSCVLDSNTRQDTPLQSAACFCEMCQHKKWRLPLRDVYLGLLLFADNCWDHRDVAWRAPINGKSVERTVETVWITNRLGRSGVVLNCTRQSDRKHHRVGNSDHSTSTGGGFQGTGSADHFDGHFTNELADRGVSVWRRFLRAPSFAV